MCGFAGFISSLKKDTGLLQSAARLLVHRGPEDSGSWQNREATAALAHQRLCIIDKSPAAAQPFSYGNRYRLVYNGELYNYIELKEELVRGGHSFSSRSDTEVVVAAYAAWGIDCLQRFEGMFAFAIWDEEKEELFAARDRFGEKPFFYTLQEDGLQFASEMKALWAAGVPKEVNESLLYNYLSFGYTGNPADGGETFYKDIYKLPPATYLHYRVATNEGRLERYWHPAIEINGRITESEAVAQFTHLFSESVRKKLRSDVAVGTSLSGGLDSSAIVAFCNRYASGQYSHKCFTAVFEGYEKNERSYAEEAARTFGLQLFPVPVNGKDLVSLMDTVMHHQEEPVTSASVLAQYKVYEAAKREGVTVLLDGQGADEILAGYTKYYRWYWGELFKKGQLGKSGELQKARELGVTEPFGGREKGAALLPQFAAALQQSRKGKEAFRHPALNREWAFSHKQQSYYSLPARFTLNDALYYNTFTNGLEELLRYADRNSMAHSTEVRLPFLDHQLVSFLFTLPPSFKIREGRTKWLLRQSVKELLPPAIVWRTDKVGFEPPQKAWMETPDVQEAIRSAKERLVSKGILNEGTLRKKIRPHGAHEERPFDWRYWSAASLFRG